MFWNPSGMKVLLLKRAPEFYLGVAEGVVLLDSRLRRLRLTWKVSNNFYLLFVGVRGHECGSQETVFGCQASPPASSGVCSKTWEQVFLSTGTSHQPHSHRFF